MALATLLALRPRPLLMLGCVSDVTIASLTLRSSYGVVVARKGKSPTRAQLGIFSWENLQPKWTPKKLWQPRWPLDLAFRPVAIV